MDRGRCVKSVDLIDMARPPLGVGFVVAEAFGQAWVYTGAKVSAAAHSVLSLTLHFIHSFDSSSKLRNGTLLLEQTVLPCSSGIQSCGSATRGHARRLCTLALEAQGLRTSAAHCSRRRLSCTWADPRRPLQA